MSFDWVRQLGYPDRSRRNRLLEIAETLPDVEQKNICSAIPKVYIEYFQKILSALNRLDPMPIRKIFVEHYGSTFEEILAAYCAEVKNAQIIQLQQGGFVGETTLSIQPFQRISYDQLLTYGWRIDSIDIPYYAVRLEQYKRRYTAHSNKSATNDILFVFGSPEVAKAITRHYQNAIESICNDLDQQRLPRIKLRPRATSRRLGITRLPSTFRGLPPHWIDQGRTDIAELCANSRAVVQVTMPSTNFLECLFVDQPVLGINTNSMPTTLIKPYLEFFHTCGVLHKDMKSLIGLLNSIDIDSWWAEVTAEAKFQDFLLTFARTKAQYHRRAQGELANII